MNASSVSYQVDVLSAESHLFRVTLRIDDPNTEGETLSLPAWIPGSYMIREFAKNIVSIGAEQNGKAVALLKQDKHTWRSAKLSANEPLVVIADVYAWDLSVRCAHLDSTHGFFNGTQLFLRVHGRESSAHTVDLRRPAQAAFEDWAVATTLPAARKTKELASNGGFGVYRADSYDALIDHPVEMGTFATVSFKAGGVPHSMVVTGRARFDEKRLARDLAKICQWHIDLFGGQAPFKRYLFLTMAVGEGYGGLEHRDSTALLCSRNDLPAPNTTQMDERYRGFLGLCSHEYFHAWNVKRIQPAAFKPYRLHEENYTRLLWVFEGFTSYYDDIALVRSGVISTNEYLSIIGKGISTLERGSGRTKQSVADSSYDAWIKYYRQDENSPNAIVSYYGKGALIAACIDLSVRAKTQGRRSLDDVMRYLWKEYGLTGRGVGENDMPSIILAATGVELKRELARWTEGTDDLPLERLLKPFGVQLTRRNGGLMSGLGLKTRAEGGMLKAVAVLDNGSAQAAGIAAGDELVALDGLRLNATNLEVLLSRYRPGEKAELLIFRRDELMRLTLKVAAPIVDVCDLTVDGKIAAEQKTLLSGWLSENA